MAFEAAGTPTSIGLITITLRDSDGSTPGKSINARVDIHDENGAFLSKWQGNLVPQLTGAQLSALDSFVDAMRAKAEAELLPGA